METDRLYNSLLCSSTYFWMLDGIYLPIEKVIFTVELNMVITKAIYIYLTILRIIAPIKIKCPLIVHCARSSTI